MSDLPITPDVHDPRHTTADETADQPTAVGVTLPLDPRSEARVRVAQDSIHLAASDRSRRPLHAILTPEGRYATIVETLLTNPDVSLGTPGRKGFSSSALVIGGRIFAMLVRDRLVVKLPRERVDALIAAGEGERFDPGHGRLMKEWVSLASTAEAEWLPLAREALAFVASTR